MKLMYNVVIRPQVKDIESGKSNIQTSTTTIHALPVNNA